MCVRSRWTERGNAPGWLRSLLLAVFFILGVLFGIACADRVSDSVGAELSAYFSAYLDTARQSGAAASAVSALSLTYFEGPVLAFFCGFGGAGAFLLPLLAAGMGFFPAYAVSCLTAAFGARGVWMAVCFFGLRSLVTLPCFFLLAAASLQTAAARLRVPMGKGRTAAADAHRWTRFCIVCLILCLGIWLDLQVSPVLLRALLERLF